MTARRALAGRVCEGCGSKFGRRRSPSGRLEGVSQFVERRFCCRECLALAVVEGGRLRPAGEWIVQPHRSNSLGAILPNVGSGTPATSRVGTGRTAAAPESAGPTPSRSESSPALPQERS